MASIHRKRSQTREDHPKLIKRQMSERTIVANQLEKLLHLGNTSPAPTPTRTLAVLSHEYPSKLLEDEDNISFFPPPADDLKKETMDRCENIENGEDRELSSSTEDSMFSSQQIESVVSRGCGATTEAQAASPPCGLKQQKQSDCDETDGQGIKAMIDHAVHKVQKELNDIRYDVVDGFSGIVHSFAVSVLHHHHSPADDGSGISVHLPSPFQHGSPCRLGVHLVGFEGGYQLAKVFEDTLAHRAGLKERDILTHLDAFKLDKTDVKTVLERFMQVEKTFQLAILREITCGDQIELIKMTFRLTIKVDWVSRSLDVDVDVYSQKVKYYSSTNETYIQQDHEYLNVDSDGVLAMGPNHDWRGQFVFDLYVPLFHDSQICAIRNTNSKEIYDAVEGKMKPWQPVDDVESSCLLRKRSRPDWTFSFESIERKGSFLTNSSGTLSLRHYSSPTAVPSSGSFQTFSVEESDDNSA